MFQIGTVNVESDIKSRFYLHFEKIYDHCSDLCLLFYEKEINRGFAWIGFNKIPMYPPQHFLKIRTNFRFTVDDTVENWMKIESQKEALKSVKYLLVIV